MGEYKIILHDETNYTTPKNITYDELIFKNPRETTTFMMGLDIGQTNNYYYIEICQQLSYRHDILGTVSTRQVL